MKILFQGDSVTDACRDRNDPHDLGGGYPRYAAAMLQDTFPDIDFEFVNLGTSFSRTEHLVERLEPDVIDVQPDIVSIMIGINDVGHHYASNIETTDEAFEANLRQILDAVKTRTHARILLVQPFLLVESDPAKAVFCEELARKQAIFKRLADEYADAYLALDEVLHTEATEEPVYYTEDGVHPTANGACFIAEYYLRAVTPLVEAVAAEGK